MTTMGMVTALFEKKGFPPPLHLFIKRVEEERDAETLNEMKLRVIDAYAMEFSQEEMGTVLHHSIEDCFGSKMDGIIKRFMDLSFSLNKKLTYELFGEDVSNDPIMSSPRELIKSLSKPDSPINHIINELLSHKDTGEADLIELTLEEREVIINEEWTKEYPPGIKQFINSVSEAGHVDMAMDICKTMMESLAENLSTKDIRYLQNPPAVPSLDYLMFKGRYMSICMQMVKATCEALFEDGGGQRAFDAIVEITRSELAIKAMGHNSPLSHTPLDHTTIH